MKTTKIHSLCFLCLLFFSCSENAPKTDSLFSSEKFDEDEFAATLKNILSAAPADSASAGLSPISRQLSSLYAQHDFHPLWIDAEGRTEMADKFLADIGALWQDGIRPERYHSSTIQEKLTRFKAGEISTAEAIALDTALTFSYLSTAHDLLFGILTPASVDSLWFHKNDTAWNTDFIGNSLKENNYPPLDSFRSNLPLYKLLQKGLQHYSSLSSNDSLLHLKKNLRSSETKDNIIASIIALETPWLTPISDTLSGMAAQVQAYQQYFGIRRTGEVDSSTLSVLEKDPQEIILLLQANLERLRWLPRTIGTEYILVNIPTQHFILKRQGNTIMTMKVVVGTPSRQTPALDAWMSNIVVNPPWGVPPTILKKDVLPGLLKNGERYLQKKGLEVFDYKGNRVDASIITTANYKRYVFRQPPGPANALGSVKFNFPNKWDIYMHDTPVRSDFGKFNRAKSSGCIRLQHPHELALYLLSEREERYYTQEKLDSLIATRKTKSEKLKHKIPVHILYLTAWNDEAEKHIRFARDFYRRDAKLMAAISK